MKKHQDSGSPNPSSIHTAMNTGAPFFVLLSRCLRSRCPFCGRGRFFAKLYQVQRFAEIFLPLGQCENCGFRFSRQPGYYAGVTTPILPILALVTGVVFAGICYFGFNRELGTVMRWGGIGVALGMLMFFRTSVAVYVALDHAIDPPKVDNETQ